MIKKTLLLNAAVLLLSMGGLKAQTVADSTVVAPEEPKLFITGYVDSYYMYNVTGPSMGGVQGRVFDFNDNQFALGLVQTKFAYNTGKSEFVADITYGPNAALGNFGNIAIFNNSAINIKQAYLSYNFTDKLNFTIGQFGTHIGYELIDAPLNFNYSLSYLFGNGPFYHTGAKLGYTVSDKFALMGGVVNGWDQLLAFSERKSIVAQAYIAPVEDFDIYLNWIGGDEYNSPSAFGSQIGSFTSLFDLTSTYQASDDLLIGVNAAYGAFSTGYESPITDEDIENAGFDEFLIAEQPYSTDGTWWGAALYLNYALTDKYALGFRGEHFSDPQGLRYFGPLEVTAFTLTGDVKLANGHINVKPEVRFDVANDDFFYDKDWNPSKNQMTAAMAFVYSF